jgi:hypothetical protein
MCGWERQAPSPRRLLRPHGIWAVDAIVEVPHNGCPFQMGVANDKAGTVWRIAREWGEVAVADATAAVAGGVVGAAVKGVIGGIQGTADGMREGWRKGSQSVAGRPGEAWVKGVIGGVQGAAKGIRDGWSMRGQFRRRTR